MTGVRVVVKSQESRAYSSIKIPTRVNSLAEPCSPRSLFSGSHPSATSYSNGLTGEKESVEGGGGGDVLIDGPMARSGVWIYEPEQIWILRTRPSCHTGHIKNYLTMHYVGDLSRKKDEHALPVRLKLQPAVQWGVAPTLSILYGPL